MTEREMLINLIKKILHTHIGKSCLLAENIADDLLENDVIVLPCKCGDTVYRVDTDPCVDDNNIELFYIDNIVICDNGDVLFKYDSYDGVICDLKSIEKGEPYLDYYKVFLTKEEAEKALKVRLKNDLVFMVNSC